MGLVLNRPSDAPVGDAVPDLAWAAPDDDGLVHIGGPVAPDGVIVLAEWDDPSARRRSWSRTTSASSRATRPRQEALELAIRRARVYAGHAGWGPGQLEDELAEDAWIVETPRREELFSEDPESLWATVLRRKGREFALLSTMPPDPSLN